MSQSQNSIYDQVLSAIRQWPVAQQMKLVQEVLQTTSFRVDPPKERRPTLAEALGILTTDKPVPTDEEAKQWLDEHRMEKYG